MTYTFERSVELPVSVERAFEWHTRPGALARMTPPWDKIELLRNDNSIQNGARVIMRVPVLGPIKKTWIAEHFDYLANVRFCDRQLAGPFSSFEHNHRFESTSATQSRLIDHIRFQPPLGPVGALGLGIIRRKLVRAFAYRHRILTNDLQRHASFQDSPRMKIAITGSTGLVGSVLVPFLLTGGHQVIRLVRKLRKNSADGTTSTLWNPDQDELNAGDLEGVDAVINLAGESIAEKRWTDQQKKRILDSRVKGTGLLARTLARLNQPPKVFFSASAIGYYSPSGDQTLTEVTSSGTGFLSEVCQAWEAATKPAEDAGIRTVHGRIGVVLSAKGGALAAQLPLFQWGIAGRIGPGTQYVPWIEIDDLVGAIHFCLMNEALKGPVNLTAPGVVTNQEFTKVLGHVLNRPAIFPVPAWVLRLALGEMTDGLLLASLRVVPQRLQQTGFVFRYPQLEPALRHLLGR